MPNLLLNAFIRHFCSLIITNSFTVNAYRSAEFDVKGLSYFTTFGSFFYFPQLHPVLALMATVWL